MPSERGPLRSAIEGWVSDLKPGKIILDYLCGLLTIFVTPVLLLFLKEIDAWEGFVDKIPLLRSLRSYAEGHKDGKGFVNTVLLTMGAITAIVKGVINVFSEPFEYALNAGTKFKFIPPADTIQDHFLQKTPDPDYFTKMENFGFTSGEAWKLRNNARPRLSAAQLVERAIRDYELRDFYKGKFIALGFTEEDWLEFLSLARYLPGPGDIVRMVAGHAWDEDTASRYGLDNDLPGEAQDELTRTGTPPEWAKRLWRSHWNIPGIQDGITMFQRLREGATGNPFTRDDLLQLMAANEVPPFFRDKLIEISYVPLTRLVVNRMYQTHIMTSDDVYNSYLVQGYSPENAERLTQLTTQLYGDEEKDITQSDILGAFNDGIIPEDDAHLRLIKIGYDDTEADLLIARAKYAQSKAELSGHIDAIKETFLAWGLNGVDAVNEQLALGLTEDKANANLAAWERARRSAVARPTLTQSLAWYKAGIITRDDYTQELEMSGYSQTYIDRFLSDADKPTPTAGG